jgi:hypothetical protein
MERSAALRRNAAIHFDVIYLDHTPAVRAQVPVTAWRRPRPRYTGGSPGRPLSGTASEGRSYRRSLRWQGEDRLPIMEAHGAINMPVVATCWHTSACAHAPSSCRLEARPKREAPADGTTRYEEIPGPLDLASSPIVVRISTGSNLFCPPMLQRHHHKAR